MNRFILAAILISLAPAAHAFDSGAELAAVYAKEVERRLQVPDAERQRYAALLGKALDAAGYAALAPQFFLLVDRNPNVQAVMIYWKSPAGEYLFIGASPVSTGKPGEYDHFETPLGVFDHSLANPDFRAEGTTNVEGLRGLGKRGDRVYDFGWQTAKRGWGEGGESTMRLLVHSTDPAVLEKRIGRPQSKGCVRIPAGLNEFIDRYGILDADYERAFAQRRQLWVLRADRQPTPWSGRYLVIIESGAVERPEWAPPGTAATTR
jgi:hypothetical protein